MGLGNHYVTQHAIERVRTRWSGASVLSERALVSIISKSIRQNRSISTPGGTYVPFSLLGKEGFLVIRRNRVVTVLGEEYCSEVRDFMEGNA
jgi:hypothetical protein